MTLAGRQVQSPQRPKSEGRSSGHRGLVVGRGMVSSRSTGAPAELEQVGGARVRWCGAHRQEPWLRNDICPWF